MRKCTACSTDLPENAKFCVECGTKVMLHEHSTCPSCGGKSPTSAKFCSLCGFNFSEKENINNLFEKQPTQALQEEIMKSFFTHLQHKIKQEQGDNLFPIYEERYAYSDFKYSFEIKVKQLAEDVIKQRQATDYHADKTKNFLLKNFEEQSDYFLVHFCADINPIPLSDKILFYANAQRESVDLLKMIEAYLYFEKEEALTYYSDFIEMPIERLRTAGKSFLFPEKNEIIHLICDQSVTGSLKEGFAFTDSAFYWRMHFEPARKILYSNLDKVLREKDWLSINGIFFNAGKAMNTKVMKLLKRIKGLQA